MPDEDVLDLEQIEKDVEQTNRVEKRIKDLSDKVRLTSEERDELKKLSEEKDGKIANLSRENEFLGEFSDTLSKYPKASQFKDEIKEKVMKGYSVEDATISTLASKGEFASPKKVEVAATIGGSAAVSQLPDNGQKSPNQMSRDEKRAALLEAEARGEIYVS